MHQQPETPCKQILVMALASCNLSVAPCITTTGSWCFCADDAHMTDFILPSSGQYMHACAAKPHRLLAFTGQLPAQQPLHNSLHPSGSFGPDMQHVQSGRQASPVPPPPLHTLLPRSVPYQYQPGYPQLPPYPGTPFTPALDPPGTLPSIPPLDRLPQQQHGPPSTHAQPGPGAQQLPAAIGPSSFAGMFSSPLDSQWVPDEAHTGPLQQAPAEEGLMAAPPDPEHPPPHPAGQDRAASEAVQPEQSSSEGLNVSGPGPAAAGPKPGEAGSNVDKKEEKEKGKKGDAASKSASSWQEDEKAAFMETYKVCCVLVCKSRLSVCEPYIPCNIIKHPCREAIEHMGWKSARLPGPGFTQIILAIAPRFIASILIACIAEGRRNTASSITGIVASFCVQASLDDTL